MSTNTAGRRRSIRNQRKNASTRNGTIINNHNSNRPLPTNNSPNQNGHRYSGRKRRNPEPSDNDSSDDDSSGNTTNDDSSEETQDSNYENINNNNHKRRRLTQPTQLSALNSGPRTTQTQNRQTMTYKVNSGRWKNTSNNKRRSTRIKYRKLADDAVQDRARIVDPINRNFIHKLQQQNELYQHVHHPNEAFMDIQQAKNMTNILKEQTRTLANEHFTITPNDYIQALYQQFALNDNGNNSNVDAVDDNDDNDEAMAIDWAAVGHRFADCFLTVPAIQFMNGPLQQSTQTQSEKKKKRQSHKKRTFTSDVPVIQPKKVLNQKKSDKTETKSRIVHLQKILRKKCEAQDGVNPFEFLINPGSYSQTVENFFDLSFIMNQGSAQMGVDDETKQPVLSYVSKAEKGRRDLMALQQDKAAKHRSRARKKENVNKDMRCNGQCIVKFNPSDFFNLINVYNINQSQIERDDVADDEEGDEGVNEKSVSSDNESDAESEEEIKEKKSGRKRRRNRKKVYRNDKEEAD